MLDAMTGLTRGLCAILVLCTGLGSGAILMAGSGASLATSGGGGGVIAASLIGSGPSSSAAWISRDKAMASAILAAGRFNKLSKA